MRIFWRNLLISFFFGVLFFLAVSDVKAKSDFPLQEIGQTFKANSFFQDPSLDIFDYLSDAKSLADLRSFLKELDPYATYTTKRDREDLAQMIKDKPASIGMDIFRDRSERVRCVPYPSSSASAMGILYGDELLQIDERRVLDLTLEEMAGLIRGDLNTEVALRVQTGRQEPRWVYAVREKSGIAPTVLFYHQKKRPLIWILRFGPHTDQELARCLERFSGDERVVLDLRGNTGGNLAAGIKCAKMFLPKGCLVAKIKSKTGVKVVRAEKDGLYADLSLILRQDRYTASAAEMFIAALLEANRGTSVGEKTAGKALVQTLFKLKNGAILKLSTEKLLNLQRAGDWEDSGLMPTRSSRSAY